MYTINTKKILVNFKGEDLKDKEGAPVVLGEVLSTILVNSQVGGKMKSFILAEKLFKESKVQVDSADFSFIKKMTEETSAFNNLVVGQVLVILEEMKEDEKEKPAAATKDK